MPKMELTKRLALEIARDLWRWLAENPRAIKPEWPGWEKFGSMECDCPLCEYTSQHPAKKMRTGCESCPLLSFWTGEYCGNSGSAFHEYLEARGNHDWDATTVHANAIADACDSELQKSDVEGGAV